jgi:uncharacterized protein
MVSLIAIGGATFIATAISILAGFGASTILITFLQFFLPIHYTLILVGCIHWVNSIYKMAFFRQGFHKKFLVFFGIPSSIATYFGAQIAIHASGTLLSQLVGLSLIIYVIILIYAPNLKIQPSIATITIEGILSGLFTGAFGFGGALRSAFLTAYHPPRALYMATLGAVSFMIDAVRVPTYLSSGFNIQQLVLHLAIALPAAFLSSYITYRFSKNIPHHKFRRIVFLFLIVIGLKFILFPAN